MLRVADAYLRLALEASEMKKQRDLHVDLWIPPSWSDDLEAAGSTWEDQVILIPAPIPRPPNVILPPSAPPNLPPPQVPPPPPPES